MKTLVVIITLVFLLPVGFCYAQVDISVTGSATYNHGKWESGEARSPTGGMEKSVLSPNVSAQIKYNRWKWQPTLEFDYRWEKFNFHTTQAPVQKAEPKTYSILAGLTRDFKYFSGYGLVGISFYAPHAALIEARPYLYHGRDIDISQRLFTYKLGVYRLWEISKIKIGPEISIQGWAGQPGFTRCRDFKTLPIIPMVGIRLEY